MELKSGLGIKFIPDMSHLSVEQKKWWGKWIEALKSGKYKQTDGQLRRGEGFCCLGVVQDVVKDGVGGRWEELPLSVGNFRFCGQDEDYNTYYLIKSVQKLLGLTEDAGFEVNTYTGKLWGLPYLNDNGATFEEIAQILQVALDGGATYEPGN